MTEWVDIDTLDPYSINAQSILDVGRAESLYVSECQEVDRHKRLRELTKAELVRTVRKNIHYEWVDLFVEDAQKWLSMQKGNIDKRRKYPEKLAYNELVRHLNNAFIREDVQILKIVSYGYDTNGYRIEFVTDGDYVFFLEVPNIEVYSERNMSEFYMGKLKFGYMSNSHCYNVEFTSYDVRSFRDAMFTIQNSPEYEKHYSKLEYMEDHS